MKKVIAVFLAAFMVVGMLSGCQNKEGYERDSSFTNVNKVDKDTNIISPVTSKVPTKTPTPAELAEPTESAEPTEPAETPEPAETVEPIDTPSIAKLEGKMEDALINYMDYMKENDNYVISPLSLKFALSLLVEGAADDTYEQLMNALGAKNLEELRVLSETYQSKANQIQAENERVYNLWTKWGETIEKPNHLLLVSNSIWKNADRLGDIKDSYKNVISTCYNGASEDIAGKDMMNRINSWVSEKTEGLIPSIVGPSIERANAVLVNTICLRDSWREKFHSQGTKEMDFTTIDGKTVTKDFMQLEEKFGFYEDEETKILVMPTESGFNVIYVIGDETNLDEKLDRVKNETVKVKVPKIDLESTFDNGILVSFLQNIGVWDAFNEGNANFSNMSDIHEVSDYNIYVDDIIQKVKFKTDEDGIEGAAATAIIMVDNASIMMPTEVKEFSANEPFSFYVRLAGESDTIFYGKVVK